MPAGLNMLVAGIILPLISVTGALVPLQLEPSILKPTAPASHSKHEVVKPRASVKTLAVASKKDDPEGDEEEAEREEILEEHDTPTPVSDSVAFMLLGMVAFQISLFYLVNFPDVDIRQFTWMSLSQTISIFCAVTLWHSIKSSIEFALNDTKDDSPLGTGVPEKIEIHLLLTFFVMFAISKFVMSLLWKNTLAVSAFGVISAHTLGFSAVDAFGEIVQMPPWNDTWMSVVGGTIIVATVLFLLLQFTTRLRRRQCEESVENDADKSMIHSWMEVCAESENEFAGFVLGLMCTQAIIFSITGSMPPIEGFPFKHTMGEVKSLFAGSCGAIVALMLFIIFVRKVFKDHETSPAMSRAIEIVEMSISMTIGWSLMFAGRWFFWVSTDDRGVGQGDLMSARMVQALAFSFFSFIAIFVIDHFADRGYLDTSALRSLMSSMGLLLGLAWEGAFGEALESIGRSFEEAPETHLIVMNSLGLCLCAIVLPAWAMYILPSAMAEVEDEEELTLSQEKSQVRKMQEMKKSQSQMRAAPSAGTTKGVES